VLLLISKSNKLDEALKGATYVQECVPELKDLKRSVFEQLDKIFSTQENKTVVVGSSTSNIPGSDFTKDLKHNSQYLVAHPVNPPFAIPLVELVPTPWTSPDALKFTRDLLKKVGQAPITLNKEIEGFVLNRLQYALLGEAFRLVEDGVCSPEDVDTAVCKGLGLRWSFMGPFETIDLNAPEGVQDYHKRYTPGILSVLKTEDNKRVWSDATVKTIDEARRAVLPKEKLKERTAWRNNRLIQLAVHKKCMDETESGQADCNKDRTCSHKGNRLC